MDKEVEQALAAVHTRKWLGHSVSEENRHMGSRGARSMTGRTEV